MTYLCANFMRVEYYAQKTFPGKHSKIDPEHMQKITRILHGAEQNTHTSFRGIHGYHELLLA